jgi:signal recognition particle subunit SRP54
MRAKMQKMMGAMQGKESPDMDELMGSMKAEEQVKVISSPGTYN